MFDYYKSSRRDASTGAPLDRQLLRGELHHIGRVRLSMEAALELGEYESAVRGLVGAIDLDTEPEWPPGMEHTLRELDRSVVQLLRQPRLLPDLEPPSARDDPYAGHQDQTNACEQTECGDHRALRKTYLAMAIVGVSAALASRRARGLRAR